MLASQDREMDIATPGRALEYIRREFERNCSVVLEALAVKDRAVAGE